MCTPKSISTPPPDSSRENADVVSDGHEPVWLCCRSTWPTCPSIPDAKSDRAKCASGNHRKSCPTATTRPAAAAAAAIASHSAVVRASGFSTSTWMPASSSDVATGAWSRLGVATIAASTRPARASTFPSACAAPDDAARAWARSRAGSTSATSSTSSASATAGRW